MRDKIQNERTEYVVGNIVSGRIYSEHSKQSAADRRFLDMTDPTGYGVYSRTQWTNADHLPDPYEEAENLLRRGLETFEGINIEEARRVTGANPQIKQRLKLLTEQISSMIERW